MSATSVSGIDAGQRQLNGPQTTGRQYRNLSAPEHRITTDINIAVPMRDGVTLMADVHRPRYRRPLPRADRRVALPPGRSRISRPGRIHRSRRHRLLGAARLHPRHRQLARHRRIRGGHVRLLRRPGTPGLVRPRGVGGRPTVVRRNVGMIGISYFAMTQLEAAVERPPPHLRAIFPVAVTSDLYEGAVHHGLFSSSFVTPFLSMLGLTAARSDAFFWRSRPLGVARWALNTPPPLHHKFATMNGEAAVTMMRGLLKVPPRSASVGRTVARRSSQAPDSRRLVGRTQPAAVTRKRSISQSIWAATGRTRHYTCRRRSPPTPP